MMRAGALQFPAHPVLPGTTQKGDITLFDGGGGEKKSDVPFLGEETLRTREGPR
jgi:hypothetical protein